MELIERTIPSGLVDYEDGDAARNPLPEALGVALAFAVAMFLKHDAARERFIQDLHAERRRVDVYLAKYCPAWSRLPFGRGERMTDPMTSPTSSRPGLTSGMDDLLSSTLARQSLWSDGFGGTD